jgi:hypothetical protein
MFNDHDDDDNINVVQMNIAEPIYIPVPKPKLLKEFEFFGTLPIHS